MTKDTASPNTTTPAKSPTTSTPPATSPATSCTPSAMNPTAIALPPAMFPSTITPPAKEATEVVLEDQTIDRKTEDETLKAEIVEASCRIQSERHVILWKINGFNLIRFVNGYGISGPIFVMGKEHETEWQLLMLKQRDDKGNPEIGFKMVKPYDTAVWDSIDYSISMVTEAGHSLKCVTASMGNDGKCAKYHFYDSIGETEDEPSLDKLFQEKTVTVEARIEYSYMTKVDRGLEEIKDESMLSTDMMRLYSTSKFSDLVVSAGDREFRIHKSILCARSSYFNRMLQEGSAAKPWNRIDLQESKEVVEAMLLYIYTGCFSQAMTVRLCNGLWEAAIKYRVSDLPIRCMNFMLDFLRGHNELCDTCRKMGVPLDGKTISGYRCPKKSIASEAISRLKSEVPKADFKSNDQMVDSKTQTTEPNASDGRAN